jgi:putative phosphoribosyl transferase
MGEQVTDAGADMRASMSRWLFEDRRAAGGELAGKLKKYKGGSVVYALPRGGVETAAEVASALGVPLDLLIARKIGHPNNPEYAIGAVTETGPPIWNPLEKAALDPLWLQQAEVKERTEAKRRRQKYLGDRQPVPVKGKTAIIIDDGIATGLTMRAAVQELKQQKPKQIIVAVPVAPPDTIDMLNEEVNDVITLVDPYEFRGAVGAHYAHFPQLEDQNVIDLIERN